VVRAIRKHLDNRLSNSQLLRFTTGASVFVSGLLVLVKLGAYFATGSISLLSSLLDSTTDIIASLITYFAVRFAEKPADADHRYGHGKAEAIAALCTAAFVTGSAIFLVVEAVNRLLSDEMPQVSYASIMVMAAAMALTAILVALQLYTVERTKNTALAADSVHYKADFLVNGAVIVALGLTAATGYGLFDVGFGLLIAGYLVWSVVPVGRDAMDMLMDRELPDAQREAILAVVRAHKQIISVHDLRTRHSGTHIFIELHIELPPDMPLLAAHDVGEDVEKAVGALHKNADVLVHFDPSGIEELRRDDLV